MNYRLLYAASVIVTVALAGLVALQSSSALGLTPQQQALAGVVAAMLGTANGFLPRVNKPPSDARTGMD